jgi:CheY-like chemotaxis protein
MFSIQVDKAMNGKEAFNMFQKNLNKNCCDTKYKLVLMDLNMPIMDGFEATV